MTQLNVNEALKEAWDRWNAWAATPEGKAILDKSYQDCCNSREARRKELNEAVQPY